MTYPTNMFVNSVSDVAAAPCNDNKLVIKRFKTMKKLTSPLPPKRRVKLTVQANRHNNS
jgi:hypothetical protein